MRRTTIPLLLASALALGSVAPAAMATTTDASAIGAAPATPQTAPSPRIAWEPCFEELGSYECGYARVPLDYDDPRGPKIRIALIRLPASDPDNRQGSIFVNPGGPGGSGIEFVAFAGPFLYTDEVRAQFDLVGFDPRGIARSTQLECFDTEEEALETIAPFPFPVTRAEERVWFGSDRALAGACEEKAGPIIDHMATANVARDLDLLRAAVGDEALNFAGYSYGSFLGTTYANLFPDRVRAVVVDGVLDPIGWTTGESREASRIPFTTRIRSDLGAQATLDEFFRLCDEAGEEGCAFAPDSGARYAALAERLLEEPLEIEDPETGEIVTVTYAMLVNATLGVMYSSFAWPDFAAGLAELEALASGDTGSAAAGFLADVDDPLRYVGFLEGFPGVACSDSVNPTRSRAWSAAARDPELSSGYFGRLWTMISSACAVWPGADDDRYLGPFTAETANPVLVVGTRYDPATRYEGAEILRSLLPNSSLLTVEAWGHTSLFLSACADAAVSEYLLTGTAPEDGTVCTQDVGPFETPVATARAADDRVAAREKAMEEIGFPY
jgi:pimeloyl-ACP methyl ester carboxylesterase